MIQRVVVHLQTLDLALLLRLLRWTVRPPVLEPIIYPVARLLRVQVPDIRRRLLPLQIFQATILLEAVKALARALRLLPIVVHLRARRVNALKAELDLRHMPIIRLILV